MTHRWVQPPVSQNIHSSVEQFAEFLFKAYKIEKRPIRVHSDKQGELAFRTVLTPGRRTRTAARFARRVAPRHE